MITRRTFIAAALAAPAVPLGSAMAQTVKEPAKQADFLVRADREEHELRQVNEQVNLGWH